MARKYWTKEEEQQLIELYKTNTYEQISIILGRTVNSIKSKRASLSIPSKDPIYTHIQSIDEINIRVKEKFPELQFLEYKGSDIPSIIKNIKCNHTWLARPRNIYLKGIGAACPICNNTGIKYTKEILLTKIISKYPDIIDITLAQYNEYTTITYKCGHTARTILSGLLYRGTKSICRACTPIKQYNTKSHEKFLEEIFSINPDLLVLDLYKNSSTCINIKSKSCGHTWKILPSNLIQHSVGSRCPQCTVQKSKPMKSHRQFLEEVYIINPDIVVLEEYKGNKIFLKVTSKTCNHTWKIHPSNFISHYTGSKCPICNTNSSKGERDIAELLSKYTEVETSNRAILEGLEIDIYLPKFKIGIEYNGEYWHSDKHKNNSYHLDKTNAAKEKDIRLIHIFEHEWLQKQDIVKSRLLGMLQQNYKLGARKCIVKELAFNEVKYFLNENHLQGSGSPSKHNLGLLYNDLLVAVMTFSKPRFNSNYDYELIRYCSLIDINIQGGASKLLKYFTSKYRGSIISYSDKRWSEGNLYKTLGFEYSHSSEPSYFYNKDKSILSRYQCQKHKLKELVPEFYEDELSESDIMANAGYNKVYDCGTDVWVYGTKE